MRFQRGTRNCLYVCGAMLIAAALFTPAAYAQEINYSRVGISNPLDISDNGTIVGANFVKERHGAAHAFGITGATVNSLIGINSQEIVTGNLTIAGVNYPYVATTDGLNWRTLPRVDGQTTMVNAISSNGKVFGIRSGSGFPQCGVIIDTNHGDEVTYVRYPGAATTMLLGGNDNGFLFGRAGGAGVPPFWTCKNGKFEPLTFAPEVVMDAVTLVADTNNRGDLLFSWRVLPSGARHAGIQSANGRFQELVYPDLAEIALAESTPTFTAGFFTYVRAPYVTGIEPRGINDRGDVVGSLAQGYSASPGGMAVLYASLPRGFLMEKGAGGP